MQCGELMYRRTTASIMMTQESLTSSTEENNSNIMKNNKETIHSGHFMVSDFEAEAQDDEDLVGVPVPEEQETPMLSKTNDVDDGIEQPINSLALTSYIQQDKLVKVAGPQKISVYIDQSLTKLLQCMTVAYRQNLTSPKWNRFKGIRLRWKDKIRLNNVIWRCWHMQFVRKESAKVCTFASPLDVDQHSKPEAVVLEGKYWKRKLKAVTAEYKKWRMFYKNKIMGWTAKDGPDTLGDIDMFEWQPNSNESAHSVGMLVDEDYLDLMSDTLFSSISQPFAFPNPREIARGAGIADFIQPGLVQLQPNLEDYMDTLEPLHDFFYTHSKLTTVPEESIIDNNIMFRPNTINNAILPDNGQTSTTQSDNLLQNHQNPLNYTVTNNETYNTNNYLPPQPPQQQTSSPRVQEYQYTAKIYAQAEPNYTNTRHHQQIRPVSQTNNIITPNNISPPIQQQPIYFTTNDHTYIPQHQNLTPEVSIMPASNNSITIIDHKPYMNKTNNDVFAVPHVNKIKRRSQSGSALLRPQPTQQQQQQLSVSATNLNLMNIETNSAPSSVLLAQLLQAPPNHNNNNYTLKHQHSAPQLLTASVPVLSPAPPPPLSPLPLTNKPSSSNDLNTTRNLHSTLASLSTTRESLGSSSSTSSNSGQHPPPSPLLQQHLSSTSTTTSKRKKSDLERTRYKEMRRVCHINAEQKRRCNIQNGFQTLQSLIPHNGSSTTSKLSKAALLHKGADHIRQLRSDRCQLRDEISKLKAEVDSLNIKINTTQSLLPASGAPVSHQRSNKMKEMFDDYIRRRTLENWKYWIFSFVMQPLLNTFITVVTTTSLEDFIRTVLQWVEQHCSLVELRPVAMNALRKICTATDILSDPSKLPDQAKKAVTNNPGSN